MALVGFALKEPKVAPGTEAVLSARLSWLAKTAIRDTPATSVHVFQGDSVLCQAGVVSAESAETFTLPSARRPILGEAATTGQEVYLPDLQILPGKLEFSYLPINCQSVLVLPVKDLVVVFGTNQAKAMTVEDLARVRTLTRML